MPARCTAAIARAALGAVAARADAMAAAVDAAADDLCRVQAEPLSHDECVRFVTRDDCGAVATFLGVTRDNFAGRARGVLPSDDPGSLASRRLRRTSRL